MKSGSKVEKFMVLIKLVITLGFTNIFGIVKDKVQGLSGLK